MAAIDIHFHITPRLFFEGMRKGALQIGRGVVMRAPIPEKKPLTIATPTGEQGVCFRPCRQPGQGIRHRVARCNILPRVARKASGDVGRQGFAGAQLIVQGLRC